MKKIFRHFRKSWYQYGLETLVVVVGVLIAFSLNNWNENRKERQEIRDYALSLVVDLQQDIEMIERIISQANKISQRIDSLGNYMLKRPINDISNIDVLCLTWIQVYRPYSWNRTTLDQMKNSGSLRLIKNELLSKKISNYDAETRHMDEDYKNDKAQSENATQLISQYINMNYPNIDELSDVLLNSIYAGDTTDIFSTMEYKEAKDLNIELLTDDVKQLYKSLNSFMRLKYNLRIRTIRELPKLVEDSNWLITNLKTEYGIN